MLTSGLGAIVGGIILKRVFAMGQYLLTLHIMGGLLLTVGISVLSLGGKKAESQEMQRK